MSYREIINTANNPIKAYSLTHLLLCIGLVLFTIISVSLLKKLRKTTVIGTMGIILLFIEIIKQLLMGQIYAEYSWSDLPFQLCSIPMYLCLVYPFAGKFGRTIELFLSSFGILGAIVAFAMPYDVFSRYTVLSVQSIIWHEMLLIAGVYCVAKEPAGSSLTKADYKNNALLYLFLALTAIGINASLADVSAGTANMFFLGPSKPNVMILDDIYENYGWIAASIAMIICSELCGTLVLAAGKITRGTNR